MHPNQDEIYQCVGNRFGLILYNPTDREGASEEAVNLKEGLYSVQCQVFKAEWTTKPEIYSLRDDGASRAANGNLLIVHVCVMSHGTAGTVRSEDGDRCVLFNDLMVRITRIVSDRLPVVHTNLCMLVMDWALTGFLGILKILFSQRRK